MRQTLFLFILTLLRNAAGLTSLALLGRGLRMMRRILVLVTVALVMAAMMLVMAMPVFAQRPCPPDTRVAFVDASPGLPGVTFICVPSGQTS